MDRKHLISGLVFLAFSIFVAVMAMDLGLGTLRRPGPGFIFFWSSVALGILSIVFIISESAKNKEAASLTDSWKGLKWTHAVIALGSLFLYALILQKLGFALSTFLLMAVLFGLGRSSWRVVLVSALLASILSIAIFRYGLDVYLPRGILGW